MTDSEVASIHRKLDEVFAQLGTLSGEVKATNQRCEPCAKLVQAHETTIHGNGRNGLLVDVAKVKSGRVGTLSVSDVCKLVASLGAAMVAVIAAMATFVN